MKRYLPLLVLPLVLAACGGAPVAASAQATQATSASSPVSTEPAEGGVTPAAENSTGSPTATAAPKNDHGHTMKNVGDIAWVAPGEDDTTDTAPFAFTVTGIRLDPECTSDYFEKPANGHFVAIDLDITTRDLIKVLLPPSTMSFDPYYWSAWDEGGVRANDIAGTAYMCLLDNETLPMDIGSGEQLKGTVILDVPSEHGTIAYSYDKTTGWEWQY